MTASALPVRVSVVEDDGDSGRAICARLERNGFDAKLIQPASPGLDDAVEEVMRESDAAFCDHRLRDGLSVTFSGAELVAELFGHQFPSVLFTGVQPEEKLAIRRNLDRIPGFLRRDDAGGLSASRLVGALRDSVDEVVDHDPPNQRRARRTPVTVTSYTRTGGEVLVDLTLSGWSGREALSWPADVLPSPWNVRPAEAEGKTFFAWVNLSEPDGDKVFLRDMEPEPADTSSFDVE